MVGGLFDFPAVARPTAGQNGNINGYSLSLTIYNGQAGRRATGG